LTAGLYCTVRFQVPRAKGTIVIPAEALIFNRNGLQVATVEDGKARIRGVQLAEDDGAQVAIASGLDPSERLIVDPPVDLVDGAPVNAVEDGEAAKARTAEAERLKPGG
jgi:multidrug efflux pump subunit AcrA (membrane-fusion protein)